MNRRDVFKAMLAVPVVAMLPVVPALSSSGFKLYGPDEWRDMARHLWSNFQEYAADKRKWLMPDDERLLEPICSRFCHALTHGVNIFGNKGDAGAAFYPEQDPDLIRENVRFGVMDSQAATVAGVTRGALSRKVRMSSLCAAREAWDDVRAYHGIDVERELVDACAQQSALEVLCEIRGDWKNGACTQLYLLNLPPHLGLVDPALHEGFSHSRGWRMRYTKFAMQGSMS